MPAQSTFAFKARDEAGTLITGQLVASSAEEVSSRLRAEGKWVLDIEEFALRAATLLDEGELRRSEAAKRVRREDVIAFAQQISVMLETGVPLSEALESFCKQTDRPEFRQVLEVIVENIQSGEPLSTAMSRWPRVFPGLMISLMKASEASGTMATMLGRVGDYLAKERRTVKQIKGALRYPIFVVSIAMLVTIFLMTFVLPRFALIYEAKSATLPLPTRVLLSISGFMTTQYMWYGPPLVGLILVSVVWSRRPSGRATLDWLRLHLPGIKSMYTHLYITRAARTMSTLLSAGVSILDVIDICRGVTGNVYYTRLWEAMAEGVREGRQVSETVIASNLIPANIASMIAAGERSGQLPDVMERIADFTQEELDGAVKQVTAFIEPAMIVFLGFVIGGCALSMLLPMFNMSKLFIGR